MIVRILVMLAAGAVLLTACGETRNDLPAERSKVLQDIEAPSTSVRDSQPANGTTDTAAITHTVTVSTSKGTFTLALYGADAPKTVANFVGLVKKKFYDGVLVHRVARDFIIQAGDPKTRDASARAVWGTGGQTADGKPLVEELDPATPSSRSGYQPGVLAMARKQTPASGTSQFFICLDKANVLPHQYTIFGRVIDGMDVVRTIGAVEVEPGPLGETDGVPKENIVIRQVRIASMLE